jgi:hypothetical protein
MPENPSRPFTLALEWVPRQPGKGFPVFGPSA